MTAQGVLDLPVPHPRLDVSMARMTDQVIAAHRWIDGSPAPARLDAFVAHLVAIYPTRTGQAYLGALEGLLDRVAPGGPRLHERAREAVA